MADNKHTKGDLQQMQAVPLAGKILMTKRRIREWYDHFDGQVYVSFSGGKDSTVLKHIVDSLYSDIPAVFVNTGLEYPEIQRFVREVKAGKYDCFNPDVEILRPEMRFDEVIKKYGYPVASKLVARYVETARRNPDSKRAKWLRGEEWTKFVTGGKWAFLTDAPFPVSDKCCVVMKHKPVNQYEKRTGRKAIIGTMATESPNREQAWRSNGCNAFEAKRPTSQPLSFWTEQDVLHYIKEFDVPYCPVYGEIKIDDNPEFEGQMNLIDYLGCYDPQDRLTTTGCSRTGCMFCMFGAHLEKEPNRFQRMKVTHPKQYAYCMDKLGHGMKEPMQTVTTSAGEFAECVAYMAKMRGGDKLGHWPEIRALLNEYCGYTLAEDEVLLLEISGALYYIADIGLRMLSPRELYDAMGFPADYIIDHDYLGNEYKKSAQVARCGNAVCPPMATALVRANLPEWCGAEITTMAQLTDCVAV